MRKFLSLLRAPKMNICVIGNSHVGAIKLAWDELYCDYEKLSVSFFACGGSGMKDMIVSDGRLKAGNERLRKRIEFTSGGESEVEPEKYDAFLIYGLGLALTPFDDFTFYTKAVKEAARKDRINRSLNFNIFNMMCAITDKPIFVAHNPFPSQLLSKGKKVDSIRLQEEIAWYEEFFKERACFLSQPEETIHEGKYTKVEYSKGSRKLETGDGDDNELHPDEDFSHMNKEYGKIWLRKFLDKF